VLAQADDEALHGLHRQLQKATEIVKVAKKGKKRNTNEEVHLEVIRATDYRDFIWRLATRAAIELRNDSIRTATSKKIVDVDKQTMNMVFALPALYEQYLEEDEEDCNIFTASETHIPLLRSQGVSRRAQDLLSFFLQIDLSCRFILVKL
jgi:hypothetical protein